MPDVTFELIARLVRSIITAALVTFVYVFVYSGGLDALLDWLLGDRK